MCSRCSVTFLLLLVFGASYASCSLKPCPVYLAKMIHANCSDVICIIDPEPPHQLFESFKEFRSFDRAFDSEVSCFRSTQFDLPVVYSPVPKLTDYHDVRVYQQAAAKSLKRALKAGFQSPLLYIPQTNKFQNTELSTILGALQELYVPIQLREDLPEKGQPAANFSVLMSNPKAEDILKEALILESGRYVARDICVGDPERMAPLRIEEYLAPLFKDLNVTVISNADVLAKEYPLFAAVNRAANEVKRHQGRIIFIEYKPPQPAKKTLMLVGKGVTYDTGGADIKAGGSMVGMSRDKCGAAVVAGFMQIVNEVKPMDVHVIAALCLVRNSLGEESYVADEIITSRAGVRVRIGNTDAEGRMCMADALCRMKEIAVSENLPDPHLFTVATLTGHAILAGGKGYSIVMDNSVAQATGHAYKLQQIGTSIGEPLEISVLRQDDFDFNAGQVLGEDVVQCNNLPTARTPRGHQVPAAFLIKAAGLEKHDLSSEKPLKYSHMDIAGTMNYPTIPIAAPVVALAKAHLSENLNSN